ncbi:glucan 1-3-beta-glucosidase [Penicillium cf. griseofulvum]|nr:glucan 1-3-beta-glucosidase [Penicillium cf. griseofulvum]
MVVGNRLGVCPTCTLVVVTTQQPTREVGDWFNYPNEKIIAQLIDVQDDVMNKNRQGKATINMSFSYKPNTNPHHTFFRVFRALLQKLEEQNVVIVASAGNHALEPEGVPVKRYPPPSSRTPTISMAAFPI